MTTMCDHDDLRRQLVEHARHCYPRTTAYIAIIVTLLLIMALIEAMGWFV